MREQSEMYRLTQELPVKKRSLTNPLAISEGLPTTRNISSSSGSTSSSVITNRYSSSIARVEKNKLGSSMFDDEGADEG